MSAKGRCILPHQRAGAKPGAEPLVAPRRPIPPEGKRERGTSSQGGGRRTGREINLLAFKGRLLDVGMDAEGNIVLIIKRRRGAESVLGAARVMVGGEFIFKAILDMGERASEERLGAAAPSGGE